MLCVAPSRCKSAHGSKVQTPSLHVIPVFDNQSGSVVFHPGMQHVVIEPVLAGLGTGLLAKPLEQILANGQAINRANTKHCRHYITIDNVFSKTIALACTICRRLMLQQPLPGLQQARKQ